MTRIVSIGPRDVAWRFEGSKPTIYVGNGWKRAEEIDPFPAYPHDRVLVEALVAAVEGAYPIPERHRPIWYLLSYDTLSYVNGWTDYGWDYDSKEDPKPWTSWIVLSGKRIPPHPAMTRYLVAHEYGHVVQRHLEALRGIDHGVDTFIDEYRKRRGLRKAGRYGGGEWHRTPGEVFANDFRVLVAGVEADYWPHSGIPRPEDVPGLAEWWRDPR